MLYAFQAQYVFPDLCQLGFGGLLPAPKNTRKMPDRWFFEERDERQINTQHLAHAYDYFHRFQRIAAGLKEVRVLFDVRQVKHFLPDFCERLLRSPDVA